MAISTPRTQRTYTIAVAWQSAEGSAASISDAKYIVARRAETDPQRIYIDPQGTFGSNFMRDTHRKVAVEPIVDMDAWGAIETIPIFLESVMMGQPTVSAANLTEAGDGSDFLSAWSLTGVRPGFNTAYSALGSAILYAKIQDENPGAGQALVSLYSDSARTALVAQGSGTDSGSVTLAEQNDSGLSGTVTIGVVSGDDSDITLTINTVTMAFASQPARFFTMWVDTGSEVEKYTDCVVQRMGFESTDREALQCSIRIVAKDYDLDGTSVASASFDHLNVYSHHEAAMRSAVDGTPVTESPFSVNFAIENDLLVPLAGSATPVKIIQRSVDISLTTEHAHSDEVQVLIDNCDADTWDSVDIKYTLSSKLLSFLFDNVKPINAKMPSFADRNIDNVSLEWAVRENNVASPDDVLTVTYQP